MKKSVKNIFQHLCILALISIFLVFPKALFATYDRIIDVPVVGDMPIQDFVFKCLNSNHPEIAFTYLKIVTQQSSLPSNKFLAGSFTDSTRAEACYILGMFYLNGWVVKKNIIIANSYFLRAVRLNHVPAMREIGSSYLNGEGVEKDISKAVYYYEQAAKLGSGPAQFELGATLKNQALAKGTPKNLRIKILKKALYWLQKAADNLELAELRDDAANLKMSVDKLIKACK